MRAAATYSVIEEDMTGSILLPVSIHRLPVLVASGYYIVVHVLCMWLFLCPMPPGLVVKPQNKPLSHMYTYLPMSYNLWLVNLWLVE